MNSKRNSTLRLLIVEKDARYGEWLRHHLDVICPAASISVLELKEFEQWSDQVKGREGDLALIVLGADFGSGPEDPQAHGLELLRRLRERPEFPPVLALADGGNELTAVRSLQLGAMDYLPKRLLTPERLGTSVRLSLRRIERRMMRRLAERGTKLAAVPDESRAVAKSADTDTNKPAENERLRTAAGNESPEPQKQVASPESQDAKGRPTASVAPDGHVRKAREGLDTIAAADAAEAVAAADEADATADRALDSPSASGIPTAPQGSEVIPGYIMRTKIGESEKALVYLATSVKLNHDVALKVSKTLRDEAAGRQFLEREYTAIVAIRDRSVVQIYDYGIHNGFEYLAMEYVPKGDLKARMYLGVSEKETLRYVEQIAAALGVVHRAGLLHRDLKPPNVMLRENDDVALIDFGLARALDGSSPSTRTGVLRGSPYYMSPEQALGEELDARSDFYSLGIMFYEMLTGRKPYTGSSAMEVLQQHVNSPLPRLPLSLSRYEPVLKRLLAKAREDRFSTAEEVVAAISVHRAPPPALDVSLKQASTAA